MPFSIPSPYVPYNVDTGFLYPGFPTESWLHAKPGGGGEGCGGTRFVFTLSWWLHPLV